MWVVFLPAGGFRCISDRVAAACSKVISISPPSIHQSLLTVRPRVCESLVYVVEVPRDLPARRPHP